MRSWPFVGVGGRRMTDSFPVRLIFVPAPVSGHPSIEPFSA
jgi:hypothetical protein